MEVLEPQANLQAALQVLELHHSKLDTTKVSQTCKYSVCTVGRILQKEWSRQVNGMCQSKCVTFYSILVSIPF